jgi:Carboxypeptidase regulatory-like domain
MTTTKFAVSINFLAFVTMLVLTAGSGSAQTAGAGTLTGSLTDQTGAAVPNATLMVRNTDTGIVRTITSNDSGIYFATFLQPGRYEVSVSKAGFAKLVRKDLTIQVG